MTELGRMAFALFISAAIFLFGIKLFKPNQVTGIIVF